LEWCKEAETRQKRCNFTLLFLRYRVLHRQRRLADFANFTLQQGRQTLEVLRRDKFHRAFGQFGFQAVQLLFEPG
jgi:hypothetical protein